MNNSQITLRVSDFTEKDGLLWMPIRQLARKMGYKNPRRLKQLYKKHEDELSQYGVVSETDTSFGVKETLFLSELGCYTIAMFANTDKAKEFRKQLARLLLELRKGNLTLSNRKTQRLELQLLKSLRSQYHHIDRRLYFEMEAYVRMRKPMNFTKAKAIKAMIDDGIPVEKISMYLDTPVDDVEFYSRMHNERKKYAKLKKNTLAVMCDKKHGRLGDGHNS